MHTLSREQVDFYNENGFLRLEHAFAADEVRRLSDELERLMQEWTVEGPGWVGRGVRRI